MQKTSMVTFDPFANERTLGLLSKAWRRTARMLSKSTLMDEMEYDLKRLETRMGVNVLSRSHSGTRGGSHKSKI